MAFRTRRKHRRGVRAFYYHPPFAPPPYSLVITKTMTVHSDARQDESAHSCWPIQCQKQQPNPSVVTRAISRVNLQPTSSSWWRLSVCYCRPVFGQYLCICIGYFLLQCCPSAQAGLGGWSLKVISDAVSVSRRATKRATKHRDHLSRARGQIKIRVYNTPTVKMAIPDLPRRSPRTFTTSPWAAAPLSPPFSIYVRRHGALSHSQRSGQYHAHNLRWISPLLGSYKSAPIVT